ncbi:hypothetical protein LC087_11440 [Bacillus carboniphilus]|uniref:DUF3887 domain-containing protein n=1 Tax=Bacillus carboniphilus TaxID=86663 RepID=A0ABY9JSN3_9BACI|nr:hypothetical protein [Bacillus carboniphilus]WLR41503.1 hypothetical protein LC087_11440 [Bacillus carboniphilus]
MQRIMFLISICFMFLLSGCGEEPLKFRNLVEANQYMKNNIQSMDWNNFEKLLASKNEISEEQFVFLKEMLNENSTWSNIVVEDRIYIYDQEASFMYMTQWTVEDGTLYLSSIHYID